MILRQSPKRYCKVVVLPLSVGSSRQLTTTGPLQLVSKNSSPRPRIPFLAQTTADSRQLLLQRRVSRVLSTENKKYVKEQTWFGVKLCLAALVVVNLAGFALTSYEGEQVEKKRPSPPEWSYLTRAAWRAALDETNAAAVMGTPLNIGQVGSYWLTCLRRLEEASCDGSGLATTEVPHQYWILDARGFSPLALDVSSKSEEWKAGYVEVILELGKIAESGQNLIFDRKRSECFPQSSIVGPSNPRPRKLPSGVVPPNEQDCEPAFPDPSLFYNRVIHGKGFTTKQRMDVLHADANWKHFSQHEAEADRQYLRALADAQRSSATFGETASLNSLIASKEHASHLARTQRATEALPMYLGCLRSVRDARSQTTLGARKSISLPPTEPSDLLSTLSKRLFRPDQYPLPDTTGNEPLSSVHSNVLKCLEGELMLYIGEILYSSSRSRQKDGLAWTREATELTSGALSEFVVVEKATKDAEQTTRLTGLSRPDAIKCRDCLGASVRNWDAMLAQMATEAEEQLEQTAATSGWRSWFSNIADKEKKLQDTQEQALVLQSVKTELLSKGIVDSEAFVPRA